MSAAYFLDSGADVLQVFVVFFSGFFLIYRISNYFKSTKIRAIVFYIWHTFFCLCYLYLTTKMPADAIFYYLSSLEALRDFKIGTVAVVYLTALFSKGLGLSYLTTFLVFNIFGTIGLIAVDASFRHATENKSAFVKYLALLVVLLPSISFWTAAIGKDSISFMSVGLLLWGSIDFKRRYFLLFIALGCLFLVRPHVVGIMIISYTLSIFIGNSFSGFQKIVFSFISLMGAVVIVPVMFLYVGLGDEVSAQRILEVVEKRQGYNQKGGGAIDISSMSLPEQLFSYFFRPLPHEANSFFALLSSIDNLFLFAVFVLFLLSVVKVKRKEIIMNHPKENRWFLLIFSITAAIIFSMTTSNLGISMRQKWMIMPILLYFMFLGMKVKWSYTSKSKNG